MNKFAYSAVALVAFSSSALAQSASQPAPAPVVAQASPAPVIVVAPSAPPPEHVQLQLSEEDRELIADGEISTGAHLAGGALAFFVGFGTGQAVEGRWGDRGWIFTVGEPVSLGLMIYGLGKSASSCASEDGSSCGTSGVGYLATGAIAYTGLRLWEVVDAFVAPVGHNRRVRAAKLRAGMNPMYSAAPYIAPAQSGNGTVGGLSLSF